MAFAKIGSDLHHYALSGAKGADTLVFVNSLGTDFRIWDRVVALLPPGLRVLRYDKRGHGLSGDAAATMAIADYADDLTALMDQLEIGAATIVGLSIGGMIALALSQRRPDLVRSLVLADTGHRIGTPQSWDDRMQAVAEGGIAAIADPVMERWFSPRYRADAADDVAGWRTMLTRTPVAGYRAACTAIRNADLEPTARNVRVPTLCIVGSTDGSTPPALVETLSTLIPGSRFEVIEGPAHLPCIETPEIVANRIVGHIADVASPIDRFATGMAVRRAVLGDAHVDQAEANATPFDRDFQRFITEGAWGSLWSRPGLTRRERSIVTLALLAALGHHDEVAMHARATRNTGATPDDIKEALLHVAVYAGVPAANAAIRIVKSELAKAASTQIETRPVAEAVHTEPAAAVPATGGRDWSTHPPPLFPAYASSVVRSPRQPLIPIRHRLLERSAPVYEHESVGALDHDLTRNGTRGGEPLGERIIVAGRVVDEDGRPVRNTLVEVWQANAAGRYVHKADQHEAPLDPNFLGAGRIVTDDEGRYKFYTIKPGAYPWGNHPNAWRPNHIHFSLIGNTIASRLVTQMYFPGDPLLAFDPIYQSAPVGARERMISSFDLGVTEEGFALGYVFDIVLRGRNETPFEA